MLWQAASEGGQRTRVEFEQFGFYCEMCILKKKIYFPGKQYLIRQKMILITTPCQKNGQEDLRGEKVNALEASRGLCQNPATAGRD